MPKSSWTAKLTAAEGTRVDRNVPGSVSSRTSTAFPGLVDTSAFNWSAGLTSELAAAGLLDAERAGLGDDDAAVVKSVICRRIRSRVDILTILALVVRI